MVMLVPSDEMVTVELNFLNTSGTVPVDVPVVVVVVVVPASFLHEILINVATSSRPIPVTLYFFIIACFGLDV